MLETDLDGVIRLGSLFDGARIDPATEIIEFGARHGFVDGDCVVYDPRGGTSILAGTAVASGTCAVTGLTTLYVRVLDDFRIQLTTTLAAAEADDDAPLTPTVNGNRLEDPTTF